MQAALKAPVYQCVMPVDFFEMGIGSIFFSRRLPGGDLVTAVFLVDVLCLGVKDCFIRITSTTELEQQLASQPQDYQPVSPECAGKLVLGAVAFARGLGLPPHKDYAKVVEIFADLDAEACESSFEYGSNGRPVFIPGPNDGPGLIRRVNKALEAS